MDILVRIFSGYYPSVVCAYINKPRFQRTDGIVMSDAAAKAFIAKDGVYISWW